MVCIHLTVNFKNINVVGDDVAFRCGHVSHRSPIVFGSLVRVLKSEWLSGAFFLARVEQKGVETRPSAIWHDLLGSLVVTSLNIG